MKTYKINRDHLLIEGSSCTNFGIDQEDIERTTHWAKKEWFDLDL